MELHSAFQDHLRSKSQRPLSRAERAMVERMRNTRTKLIKQQRRTRILSIVLSVVLVSISIVAVVTLS